MQTRGAERRMAPAGGGAVGPSREVRTSRPARPNSQRRSEEARLRHLDHLCKLLKETPRPEWVKQAGRHKPSYVEKLRRRRCQAQRRAIHELAGRLASRQQAYEERAAWVLGFLLERVDAAEEEADGEQYWPDDLIGPSRENTTSSVAAAPITCWEVRRPNLNATTCVALLSHPFVNPCTDARIDVHVEGLT